MKHDSLIALNTNSDMAIFAGPASAELVQKGLDSLEEQNAEYWFQRGEECQELGDLGRAIECYNKALNLAPCHAEALAGKGFSLLHHKCECFRQDPEATHRQCAQAAAQTYAELLKLHLDKHMVPDPSCYNNYGVAQDRCGFQAVAFEYYGKAVEANPSYYTSWTNLGSTHHERKEYDKSRQCHEKALRLCDSHSPSYYGLALLEDELKESEQAIGHYDMYLELVDHDRMRNADGIAYARERIRVLKGMRVRKLPN